MEESKGLLDYDDPELIAALQHHLQLRGWHRAELSRRTQINSSTISDWLRGRYGPGSEAVRTLCEAFGVSRSEFWTRGEEIVKERRRQDEERRRTHEMAELESAKDAERIAEALLRLEPGVRDEAVRIVLSRTELRKAAND